MRLRMRLYHYLENHPLKKMAQEYRKKKGFNPSTPIPLAARFRFIYKWFGPKVSLGAVPFWESIPFIWRHGKPMMYRGMYYTLPFTVYMYLISSVILPVLPGRWCQYWDDRKGILIIAALTLTAYTGTWLVGDTLTLLPRITRRQIPMLLFSSLTLGALLDLVLASMENRTPKEMEALFGTQPRKKPYSVNIGPILQDLQEYKDILVENTSGPNHTPLPNARPLPEKPQSHARELARLLVKANPWMQDDYGIGDFLEEEGKVQNEEDVFLTHLNNQWLQRLIRHDDDDFDDLEDDEENEGFY